MEEHDWNDTFGTIGTFRFGVLLDTGRETAYVWGQSIAGDDTRFFVRFCCFDFSTHSAFVQLTLLHLSMLWLDRQTAPWPNCAVATALSPLVGRVPRRLSHLRPFEPHVVSHIRIFHPGGSYRPGPHRGARRDHLPLRGRHS